MHKHFFHILENRGPPGDLYVCLDIEEPSDIKRDGINLYSTVSISYVEAILGTVQQVIFFM
jgi:molecular chaperone DnaJ